MNYGNIPRVDKPVSRIVQGCTILSDGVGQRRSDDLLDEVYEAGIVAFDHAWVYGDGRCERAFGSWLKDRGVRNKVVIIDKGCHPIGNLSRVSPEVIESDINDSLQRLGVQSIDLWLFHRDDPRVPIEPLVDTLNRMVGAGKIHAFGASNWSRARIREANAYAEGKGLIPFSASSPHFSLAEQKSSPWGNDCVTISGSNNSDVRAWYARSNLGVLCWSSLAGGFFSGRYSRARRGELAVSLPDYTIRAYDSEDNWRRLERAGELAAEKGVTVAQIAIAYVLHQRMNTFAVVRASNSTSIRANVGALGVDLTPQELDWLDLHNHSRATVSY